MIFGNGAVANVELKNTKGHHAGWLNIAMGYGFGVMFPRQALSLNRMTVRG